MLNEKVEIEVYGRKLVVEMEGLDPLQISQLAAAVDQRMKEIERESRVVDSSKLAILTALELAADNARLRAELEGMTLAEERRLDAMTIALQKAIEAASSPEKP